MCEYCRRSGYHAMGCPNAPDDPRVYRCAECGEAIYEGDKVYFLQQVPICEDCVESSCETASLE